MSVLDHARTGIRLALGVFSPLTNGLLVLGVAFCALAARSYHR